FVVLVPTGASPAVLDRMTGRIRKALVPEFTVSGHRVRVGISAGTALGGRGTTADELMGTADERMYAAKRAARTGQAPAHR
ncbi:diguanylate cyclase with GGDEF domain, partial [Kineococcus xinjiangensis]